MKERESREKLRVSSNFTEKELSIPTSIYQSGSQEKRVKSKTKHRYSSSITSREREKKKKIEEGQSNLRINKL